MKENPALMPLATAHAAQDAIDELPLPYIEMDSAGIITRANRAALALYPLEHGELIGRIAWDLMAREEKEPSCAAYLSFMESGEDPPPVLRSIYDRSGEFRIYEMHRSFIRDAEGRTAGMRMVCVDVTAAKRTLEEAHRTRLWLQNILGSVADAVLVTDALGFIRLVNPAAEALLGWKAEELIGKAIEKGLPLLKNVPGSTKTLDFTMALEGPCKAIASILDREHRELRVEIATSPILDKESGFTTGMVSVLRRVGEAS
jgi:PAS domain S-box-containing protein